MKTMFVATCHLWAASEEVHALLYIYIYIYIYIYVYTHTQYQEDMLIHISLNAIKIIIIIYNGKKVIPLKKE